MASQSDTILLEAKCLCGKHKFSTRVPTSKLPLEGNVCHCDSCRHSIGALYVAETTWPEPKEAVALGDLHRYHFSPNVTYRFCGTCSSLMFYESVRYPSKLGVFTGALNNNKTVPVRFARNIYVEDTKDGGASVFLRHPNADRQEIPRYRERDGDELPYEPWPQARTGEKDAQPESLPLWCHCKGVQLRLHRGDYASRRKEDLPWFIDPESRKPLANFDGCDSCRSMFGVDVVNWTFASLSDISPAEGSTRTPFPATTADLMAAVDRGDTAVVGPTLTYYESSPGVQRYFCRTCSASVFYACDDRPTMVDVAVGLLEAPDGARAESFLSWNLGDSPQWANDVVGGWREGLHQRVRDDAEAYRIATGYPKHWRRFAREAQAAKEAAASSGST